MLGPQTNLVTRYLDLLSQSQRVTATNIANADTPGYRTRQLEFGSALRAALDNPAGATNAEQATVRELGTLPVKNDGNDVVMERELQQLSETGVRFSHALLMLKGGIKAVRDAIHEGEINMGLYDALGVGASDSRRNERVEALTENIANSETTRTPQGGPYRRRRVVFESALAGHAFGTVLSQMRSRIDGRSPEGVRVARMEFETADPEMRFEPDHPDANEAGYVAYPGFNPIEDMVDLTASVRSYQANLAVIDAVRQMINATIDVAR